MNFAVIYTAMVREGLDVEFYKPFDGSWKQTEGDSQYLSPDRYQWDEENVYGWKKGHHRKWVADNLTEEEFEEFLKDCHLFATRDEGSSLWGVAPMAFSRAVVFTGGESEDYELEANVTPYGTEEELVEWLARHRQRVPATLTDDPAQRYFWPKLVDRREPFTAAAECLHHLYG